MDTEQRYWFRLRTNGIGWTPVSWKGWFVVACWALLVGITIVYALPVMFLGWEYFFALIKILVWRSLLFILIMLKKGEPPLWWQHMMNKTPQDIG